EQIETYWSTQLISNMLNENHSSYKHTNTSQQIIIIIIIIIIIFIVTFRYKIHEQIRLRYY
ncbi:MAG: hypothetical protein N7Q72_03385, partial [Spiroplasma sp. Tabriz.8]|nr:hypothetical protein [Candidatus Regiella insecticola]MCZ8632286.1 hypothetical protein [Spiroplasma sp. Tabriz.8]